MTPGARETGLAGFRLVTLCGSAGSMHDAMRDTQDLIEPAFTARGIDVRPVDLGDWSVSAVPKLVREIARQRPDGILMQYPTGAFGHALGPVLLPLVHHAAPTMVMLHEFSAAHIVRKAAVGALLLRADRIGITAERERKRLTRFYPWLAGRLREVQIISNVPSRDWAPTEPPTVTYFGQLRPNKGIEEFIAASRKMGLEQPGTGFQIVGAVVPKLQDYAAEVQLDAGMAGITVVADAEIDLVANILARSTVALLPFPDGASFRRGSMFAAAACGTPIVSTTGPDTPPELAASLDPAVSVDDLVAVTLTYLRDPAARDRAHRRSVRLSAQYGLEQSVDSYCKVFAELADMGRGATGRLQPSESAG